MSAFLIRALDAAAAIITISDEDEPAVDLFQIADRQKVCSCEVAKALRMEADRLERECASHP
ncbi:hypothetical protein GV791_14680 [Nocardia cyriacigeorgica]|uniref:Uncharacterized protein n=1 Tax=Nocardia cyriacigeorgica TaxID=135487 RepID=A0A6P1CMK0_9NOCA|nr:hypothetical protein [Nocardia cyriacigeorgica]NEW33801.1 hypothetical protein [Nocardia cyriacigeorgica]